MHPDASLRPDAHVLFSQILSNISRGVHPPSPTSRPSLLEHIARTRYSSLLKPAIAKAWKEQTLGNVNSDFQTYRTGPSPSFCKKVLEDALNAFSEDDWKIINQEVDDEWELAKERYRREIIDLYGDHASEELARSLPSVLQPLMSTLESLTGMSFILWAGGPLNGGIGLINVTSDFKELDVPLVIPLTQEDLFTEMAHQWMGKNQDVFLDQCIETAKATTIKLPQNFFQSSSPLAVNDLNTFQEQLEITRAACTVTPQFQPPAAPDLPPTTSNNARPLHLNKGMEVAGATQKRKGPFEGLPHSRSPATKKQRISTAISSSTSLSSAAAGPRQHSRRSPTSNTTTRDEVSAVLENVNMPPPGPQCHMPPQAHSLTAPGPLPTVYLKHKHISAPLPGTPASISTILKNIPVSAKWLTQALSSIVGIDIGPLYHHLIKLLIELEMLHDFNKMNGPRLTTASRPEEVGKWIIDGRGSRGAPKIKILEISRYSTLWWQWWKNMQPGWRKYDNEGMPISVVPQGKAEDWSCLLVPGANGLLSVVASLYWWGCAVTMGKGKTKRDGKGWDEAAGDCGWVMERLVSAVKRKKAQANPGEAHVATNASTIEATAQPEDRQSMERSDSN